MKRESEEVLYFRASRLLHFCTFVIMWSILVLIFITLCVGIAAWLFFLWAVKSGQYDDVEGPKYRMMDEDKKKEDDTDKEDLR